MTDQEKFIETIQHALKNNWGCFGLVNGEEEPDPEAFEKLRIEYDDDWDLWEISLLEYPEEGILKLSEKDITFDKSFCQAVFVEEILKTCDDCGSAYYPCCPDGHHREHTKVAWNYHRHKLLDLDTDTERIEYIYKFIGEK
jgi:hypothetical protein